MSTKTYTKTYNGGAAFGILVLLLAWVVMAFLVGVAIINWNVNDIIQHGPNFWNIFWLSGVALVWFGTARGTK